MEARHAKDILGFDAIDEELESDRWQETLRVISEVEGLREAQDVQG